MNALSTFQLFFAEVSMYWALGKLAIAFYKVRERERETSTQTQRSQSITNVAHLLTNHSSYLCFLFWYYSFQILEKNRDVGVNELCKNLHVEVVEKSIGHDEREECTDLFPTNMTWQPSWAYSLICPNHSGSASKDSLLFRSNTTRTPLAPL